MFGLKSKNMKRRTRLKITMLSILFMVIVTSVSMFLRLENLAMTSVGGLISILGAYVWGETKRPSDVG
jgi:hypothetical protein